MSTLSTQTKTDYVAIYSRDDIRIESREDPPLGPGETRVRVEYVGICGSELHSIHHLHEPLERPIVWGHEYSGVVEEVAPDVTLVKPGDRVACPPCVPCFRCHFCLLGRLADCQNFSWATGALGERITLAERFPVPIPDTLGLREAALTEPLACVLRAFERVPVSGGHIALVIGAGPIGLLTAAASVHFGAAKVFVSEPSEPRRAIAAAVGAIPIDPTAEDLVVRMKAETEGRGPDVVYECVGGGRHIKTAVDCVGRGGTVAVVGVAPQGDLAELDATRIFADEISIIGVQGINTTFKRSIDLLTVMDVGPVITHEFPLDAAAEAINVAATASGGKVMIRPNDRTSH